MIILYCILGLLLGIMLEFLIVVTGFSGDLVLPLGVVLLGCVLNYVLTKKMSEKIPRGKYVWGFFMVFPSLFFILVSWRTPDFFEVFLSHLPDWVLLYGASLFAARVKSPFNDVMNI